MQKRNDHNSIMLLRDALQLGDYRIDVAKEKLTKYREYLEGKFDKDKDRKRQKLGLVEFRTDATWQCWTSDGSVVLVLSGKHDAGVSLTVMDSWLSPVAVDLIQDLLEQKRLVAFEMCKETSTIEVVLAHLIYQLLDQNPKVIRDADNWKEIEGQISNRGSDPRERLLAALLKIIDLQDKREHVYIVLNRPELNDGEDVAAYINTMLMLARKTKGVLKVLIVQRSDMWEIEENKHGILQGMDQKFLQRVRLDQRRVR
jgi:hypothetical protein